MSEIVYFVMNVAINFIMPIVIVIGCLVSLLGGVLTFRFCYYYYLVHGVILWGMAEDDQSMSDIVTEIYGVKSQVGIMDAFIVLGIIMLFLVIGALVWPAILIIFIFMIPICLYPILFKERHKRTKFNLKLKGSYGDD